MKQNPFAEFTKTDGYAFHVHYTSVICIEERREGGCYIMVRAGNETQSFRLITPHDVVLERLNKARLADISSFNEP